MERLPVSLALAVCLAVCLTAAALPLEAQTPASQGFGEQVDVNVVNVDVFVTDKDGRPVTGLQRDDFEIFEDGKRVEVSYFEAVDRGSRPANPAQQTAAAPESGTASAAPAPTAPAVAPAAPADGLNLVVYIDNLHIRAAHRARVARQLRDFLGRGLRPGDRVMLVTYDNGLRVRQAFTSDPAVLNRALDTIEKLPAKGDSLALARRTAIDQILQIKELAATTAGGTTLSPGKEDRGPVGEGGMGRGEGEGEGEDSGADEEANVLSDPLCPMDVAEPARSFAQNTRQQVRASIGALKALVNSLSGLPGRKALLHVSDGITVTPGEEVFQVLFEICGGGGGTSGLRGAGVMDSASMGNMGNYRAQSALTDAQSYSTAKDWSDLASHANTHRVTFYTLQASGLETNASSDASLGSGAQDRLLGLLTVSNIEMQNRQSSLTAMASDTGGRAMFNTNDFLPALSRMQEDFDSYYSLGFVPVKAGDGREHRLEVKTKRRDLRIRHPLSYRNKPAIERAVDRTLAALFYGNEDNPLEVALEFGEAEQQGRGTYNLPVRLRIPLHKLFFQDDLTALQGKVRLLVAAQGPHGESSKIRQVEIPIKIPRDKALVALGQSYLYELTLTLPAGDQRVAVAVRDEGTALTSYLARGVRLGGGDGTVQRQR